MCRPAWHGSEEQPRYEFGGDGLVKFYFFRFDLSNPIVVKELRTTRLIA